MAIHSRMARHDVPLESRLARTRTLVFSPLWGYRRGPRQSRGSPLADVVSALAKSASLGALSIGEDVSRKEVNKATTTNVDTRVIIAIRTSTFHQLSPST